MTKPKGEKIRVKRLHLRPICAILALSNYLYKTNIL